MQIKNLSNTPLKEIVDCMVISFADYIVKMPTEVDYWGNRYRAARVDYEASIGVFDKSKLVAFIMIGIDYHNDKLTAFNTGTGVIPEYRGQALVDKMYEYAYPIFKTKGVEKCMLEVIQENPRAVRVYERIGFKILRNLNCFKGDIAADSKSISIQKTNFQEILKLKNPNHHFYAWDFVNEAITLAQDVYDFYFVKNDLGQKVGYFIINPSNNTVAQLEAFGNYFEELINGISQVSTNIRIINVDDKRIDFIGNLLKAGLENYIDQFEMEMDFER